MQVNQVRLGAVLSYVSMGLSTLISLIYTPIMLGRLGETEYGVYGAVGPIISYLLLLSMGLGSAYIRYYSQAKVAKDRREMAKLNGMFLVTCWDWCCWPWASFWPPTPRWCSAPSGPRRNWPWAQSSCGS